MVKKGACQRDTIQECRSPMRHMGLRFDSWVEKIPPEEETATYSSILAWEIPWTKMGYSPQGIKEPDNQAANHTLTCPPVTF